MLLTHAKDTAQEIFKTLQKNTELNALFSQVESLLNLPNPNLWEAALTMAAFMNVATTTSEARLLLKDCVTRVREYQGQKARQSTEPTTIVFGTSGWRDKIGEGFTLLNVHKTIRGIIEMMRTPEFLQTNGYKEFIDVQRAGIVILRDNRFLGDECLQVATQELVAQDILVYNAGECPTGVGSAVVTELKAAGSINFTPSHNPMDFAGIKFNPADGGPADPVLTQIIETKANAFMCSTSSFVPASPNTETVSRLVKKINAQKIFADYLKKSKVLDLKLVHDWLLSHKKEVMILVDHCHGSSRGYVQAILGPDVLSALTENDSIEFLHCDDDVSFHGIKPEPSAVNQKPLIDKLKKKGRRYSLAVFMDPDADRIRFADAHMDIEMNFFGPIAYAGFLQSGLTGGVATTAPSSDFALEIAKKNHQPAFETAVGFKYFRPYLSTGRAIVAFEESDGISFGRHTLEKDAIGGFVAALTVMAKTNQNLSEIYTDMQKKYGYFYPQRTGVELKGININDWQTYKKNVMEALEKRLFKKGDEISVGGVSKIITDINTIDGLKVLFADRSWILLRASGTETKFRIYYEVVSETPLSNIAEQMTAYQEAGVQILEQARKLCVV